MCPAALIRVLCHLACGLWRNPSQVQLRRAARGSGQVQARGWGCRHQHWLRSTPPHNKTPARTAPMTLTRPLAFRSCCPGQRLSTRCIPLGAGHVMGKTTPVNMDNGAGHRAHGHHSFPETPAVRPGLLSGASGLFSHVTPGLRSACHMAFGVTSNRAARSCRQASGWSLTSCASFSGSIFRIFRRLWGLGSIRLAQRLIEAIPTENRSAVSPRPRAFPLPYRQNMPTKGYRICHHKQYHINVAKLYQSSIAPKRRGLPGRPASRTRPTIWVPTTRRPFASFCGT